jgi:hypothetical protein
VDPPAAPYSSAAASLTYVLVYYNVITVHYHAKLISTAVPSNFQKEVLPTGILQKLVQRKTPANVELKGSFYKRIYKRRIARSNFTVFKYPHQDHTHQSCFHYGQILVSDDLYLT